MSLEDSWPSARRETPELHRVVFTARGQSLAVGGEGYTPDRTGVSRKRGDLPACGDVPHLQCRVRAARDQEPAIRRKSNVIDLTFVRRQSRKLFLRGDIPQLQDSSPTTGSQDSPTGGECQGLECRRVL